ncbi:DUF6660 family protein [Chryseobacterium taklimakanense]|uniref:DUF6660 family protein n=2 Tax=Bacteroidota/Chlorobiota group TaxID=68336 RepID=UPI0038992014
MLGMAILPCSDAYYRCATNNVSDSVNVLEHNHKTEHKDFCSPFCSCQCCGTINGVTLDFRLPEINELEFQSTDKRKVPLRNIYILSQYNGNIWQPPKINV